MLEAIILHTTLTILPIDSALYVHLWPISFNYSLLRQIIRNKMAYTYRTNYDQR